MVSPLSSNNVFSLFSKPYTSSTTLRTAPSSPHQDKSIFHFQIPEDAPPSTSMLPRHFNRSRSCSIPSSPPRLSLEKTASDDCLLQSSQPPLFPSTAHSPTVVKSVNPAKAEPPTQRTPAVGSTSAKPPSRKSLPSINFAANCLPFQSQPIDSATSSSPTEKRRWGPIIRKPFLQPSRFEGDIERENAYPHLPPLSPFVFANKKTTSPVKGSKNRKVPVATSSLRFSNREELSHIYRCLVELHGWSKEEEEEMWKIGLLKSKKRFVESELAELEEMGFDKGKHPPSLKEFVSLIRFLVPTRQEMDCFHEALLKEFPYNQGEIDLVLAEYGVDL